MANTTDGNLLQSQPTNDKETIMSDKQQILIEAGATRERRKDRHGETKSGWWLDGVYLGSSDAAAVEALRG